MPVDSIVIRLIEPKDVITVNGEGMKNTSVGWAIDYEGETVAICGVAFINGIVVAFSKIKPGTVIPKKTIVKTAIRLDAMIKRLPWPDIYAFAAHPRILMTLGWKWLGSTGDVEVFKCKRP
jgi:hypothetical protein